MGHLAHYMTLVMRAPKTTRKPHFSSLNAWFYEKGHWNPKIGNQIKVFDLVPPIWWHFLWMTFSKKWKTPKVGVTQSLLWRLHPSAGTCSMFTSLSEQKDRSLQINADSLKSTLCRHINNELFKILCMLLKKVTQPWEEDWVMSEGWQPG